MDLGWGCSGSVGTVAIMRWSGCSNMPSPPPPGTHRGASWPWGRLACFPTPSWDAIGMIGIRGILLYFVLGKVKEQDMSYKGKVTLCLMYRGSVFPLYLVFPGICCLFFLSQCNLENNVSVPYAHSPPDASYDTWYWQNRPYIVPTTLRYQTVS